MSPQETCPCTIAAIGPATPTADPVASVTVPGKLPVGAPPGTVVVTSSKEVFVSRGTLIDLDDSTESIAPASYAHTLTQKSMSDKCLQMFQLDRNCNVIIIII